MERWYPGRVPRRRRIETLGEGHRDQPRTRARRSDDFVRHTCAYPASHAGAPRAQQRVGAG